MKSWRDDWHNTKPRGIFSQAFKEQGFIEVNADRSLTIEAEKLDQYTSQNAFTEDAKADIDMNAQARSLRSCAMRSLREMKIGRSKAYQEVPYAQKLIVPLVMLSLMRFPALWDGTQPERTEFRQRSPPASFIICVDASQIHLR